MNGIDGRLNGKDPYVVTLAVNGDEEETRPLRVVAQRGPHKFFAVLEGDLHLAPLYPFPFQEGLSLFVGRVTAEIFDKEKCFQVLEEDELQAVAGGGAEHLQVETVLVGKEVPGEPLRDPPIGIPDDHFDLIHDASPP